MVEVAALWFVVAKGKLMNMSPSNKVPHVEIHSPLLFDFLASLLAQGYP